MLSISFPERKFSCAKADNDDHWIGLGKDFMENLRSGLKCEVEVGEDGGKMEPPTICNICRG